MLVNLLGPVDKIRQQVNGKLDEATRSKKGQFMTPASSAHLLAKKFRNLDGELNILDAGAGVGSLTSALVERALNEFSPSSINTNVWELENVLVENLNHSLELCKQASLKSNAVWNSVVNNVDFISHAVSLIKERNNGGVITSFNKAILNPPYLKITALSEERKLLRSVGVETGNLYSCFVALALMLLEEGGELVAITPRSFCNGPYFKNFRQTLLDGNNLNKLHIFESRTRMFKGDKVLQENVIFHIVKGEDQGQVEITSSTCAEDPEPMIRKADFNEVVSPNNPNRFIHIVTNDKQAAIAARIRNMPCSLEDLGIKASTGKVVDFRTRQNLRDHPEEGSVPLIFPVHFKDGEIKWPQTYIKKPNALARNTETEQLLVPNGNYVLTKRLSAKEETRRIVAAVYAHDIADVEMVGFENKTNYFHANGEPLEYFFAKGLCTYLNSTVVDQYFRQFNGHTQVNATDLKILRYPDANTLTQLGKIIMNHDQNYIDKLIAEV